MPEIKFSQKKQVTLALVLMVLSGLFHLSELGLAQKRVVDKIQNSRGKLLPLTCLSCGRFSPSNTMESADQKQ
jgi:hypothetical protein